MLKSIKKIVKRLQANPLIGGTLSRVNLGLLWFGSRNRLTSLVYNFLFFFNFSREQHANVRGKYLYYKNLKRPIVTRSQLRRNIHRLEKGMIMQPRRSSFASNYIGETLAVYRAALEQFEREISPIDFDELIWAEHVLSEYFDIVSDDHKNIAKARAVFEDLGRIEVDAESKRSPYLAKTRNRPKVSYEDFYDLAMHRRSVRWFKKEKIPRDLIDKSLLAARQSPSACNRLPYEFRIFDDKEMVQKVAGLPFGAGGYAHNIPAIAVVVGKLENYFSARDRHAIYIDSSLAAMAFMFALETQGLSSSVINWPDFEPLEIKMQKTLGLDVSDRVIMLIAIGYADPEGGIPFSQKKELSTFRKYNEIKK